MKCQKLFLRKIRKISQYTGMGNFMINPDFRIENFHSKHETSLLLLFTRPPFCVKSYLGL